MKIVTNPCGAHTVPRDGSRGVPVDLGPEIRRLLGRVGDSITDLDTVVYQSYILNDIHTTGGSPLPQTYPEQYRSDFVYGLELFTEGLVEAPRYLNTNVSATTGEPIAGDTTTYTLFIEGTKEFRVIASGNGIPCEFSANISFLLLGKRDVTEPTIYTVSSTAEDFIGGWVSTAAINNTGQIAHDGLEKFTITVPDGEVWLLQVNLSIGITFETVSYAPPYKDIVFQLAESLTTSMAAATAAIRDEQFGYGIENPDGSLVFVRNAQTTTDGVYLWQGASGDYGIARRFDSDSSQFKIIWLWSSSGFSSPSLWSFKTIVVSGQSDVVADQAADTLTLAASTGITITTNATTDTITFAVDSSGITNFGKVKVNSGDSLDYLEDQFVGWNGTPQYNSTYDITMDFDTETGQLRSFFDSSAISGWSTPTNDATALVLVMTSSGPVWKTVAQLMQLLTGYSSSGSEGVAYFNSSGTVSWLAVEEC